MKELFPEGRRWQETIHIQRVLKTELCLTSLYFLRIPNYLWYGTLIMETSIYSRESIKWGWEVLPSIKDNTELWPTYNSHKCSLSLLFQISSSISCQDARYTVAGSTLNQLLISVARSWDGVGSQQSSLRENNHPATYFRTKDESLKSTAADGLLQTLVPVNSGCCVQGVHWSRRLAFIHRGFQRLKNIFFF
jgi:hypothetical protein